MPEIVTERDNRVPSNLELLLSIQEMRAELKAHAAHEMTLQTEMAELLKTFQLAKGAALFVKVAFFIAAPVAGFVYWLRDHVRL